jgi:hypothetical protein
MKRRRFFKTVIAAPAVPALVAQQPVFDPRPPVTEAPKLETALADDAAEMTPRFFTAQQFAVLRRLSEILMPAMNGAPGALDARAPEFLDFLIGQSPQDRQQVYRAGLDALNTQAKRRFDKLFADLDATQAASLLSPLREPWTYEPPTDPLARFLRAAKQDVRTATMNSREYTANAAAAGGRRGMGGVGLYWSPVE